MNSRREMLSEWYGDGNSRTAILYHTWSGYEVEFLVNNEQKEVRRLYEHSRQYAEDACENWIEEIIK